MSPGFNILRLIHFRVIDLFIKQTLGFRFCTLFTRSLLFQFRKLYFTDRTL